MMGALCAGGAILGVFLGVFLHVSNILLDEGGTDAAGFQDTLRHCHPDRGRRHPRSIEGVHLSLPLVWLLGMFGDRTTGRADSRR
jgi:hypothetical protein